MLDLSNLEAAKKRGDKIIARCPVCATDGGDRRGEHLVIYATGQYGCCACPGDAEHKRAIFSLAGSKDAPQGTQSRIIRRTNQRPKPLPPVELPHDFERMTRDASRRVYESRDVQSHIAAEFGVAPETIRELSTPEGGALGFFPRSSYKEMPLNRDRIGYIYPAGIKIRSPWGDGEGKPRFIWLCGRATEPWRYTLAVWRPWVTRWILTEGESDLIALVDAGLGTLHPRDNAAVIASPGTSFVESWGRMFSDRDVTISFDLDGKGRAAAEKVSGWLRPFAASVRTFNPKSLAA